MSLFVEIRYPLRKLYEDGYTTHKLLFANSKIAVIWMSLYNWRVNPTSITQSSWSPSQIDAIYALVEQMEYLQLNGYSQAYKTSVQAFFNHTIKHLAYAKALSPKYDSYIKELTSWRNHAFSLYIREYGILKAIIYWFDVRILRRLRQLSKK